MNAITKNEQNAITRAVLEIDVNNHAGVMSHVVGLFSRRSYIVQDYYGRQLQHSGDLKTSACCDISQMPEWLKPLLARIHPEVLSRYYGCGLVCPPLLTGCRVLDLVDRSIN